MARRTTDAPSRIEITQKTDDQKESMDEKDEQLGVIKIDVEIVDHTSEELELDGTSEAAEKITESIDQAAEVTREIFDDEDEALDQAQDETEEHENDLTERSDSSQSDLEKVSDSSDQLTTKETADELEQAQSEINEDIEFLEGQNEDARQVREETEQRQQEYRIIVHGKGGR